MFPRGQGVGGPWKEEVCRGHSPPRGQEEAGSVPEGEGRRGAGSKGGEGREVGESMKERLEALRRMLG